jgi:hypothetical protein
MLISEYVYIKYSDMNEFENKMRYYVIYFPLYCT